jgi:hypothetical protein
MVDPELQLATTPGATPLYATARMLSGYVDTVTVVWPTHVDCIAASHDYACRDCV